MATSVIMPRQGQSVESCIISKWFKSVGDTVHMGDILFAYETDKASFESEAETEGILVSRLFEEGDEVPVLQIVAFIGIPGESLSDSNIKTIPAPSSNNLQIENEISLTTTKFSGLSSVSSPSESERLKISPRARNRAESLGISLKNIIGTGPNGRIVDSDVINASKLFKDSYSMESKDVKDEEIIKVSNVRKIIARKMQESLQNSAQLTHHTSADARAMLKIRIRIKEAREKGSAENITINDMVCYAVIKALQKHPDVNCHFLGNTIKKFKKVHLGIAVDTDRGLMVPSLRNADDYTLSTLSDQIKELANFCKKGNIDPDLLASEASSFTVSNLGAYGVEIFTPVINLPQVAILGVNTIIYRPAELGSGTFGFIPVIGLSLTYDHRAIDGAPASAFLREIKFEIEKLEL